MEAASKNKKICLVSLGCPKNLVDAEMMLGFLQKDGFSFSTNPAESEVIVVNTCGFVEDSKKESIDQLLQMAEYKETGNCKVLVATGCLSQRYSETLSHDLPEVDAFVGLGEFDRLSSILREQFAHSEKRVYVNENFERDPLKKNLSDFTTHRQILPDPDLPRILATPRHYTYVKVSEGCSHRCSFCIIPHIRGDLKSRSIASIAREVQSLSEQGVKEFNLIAQDLNEFGKDLRDGSNLTELFTALEKVPGDFWVRPLYMYPLEFSDSLIQIMRDSKHLVKYADMPLQHINDRVMRSMKRGSPSRYVRQVLEKLKTAMPEIAIRTTFIVGYPGETDAEFQELYDFVKDTEFNHVGVFQYSQEEGTSAALLPDQLADEVKQERFDRLMSLQQKISLKKNQALVGKTLQVLCEKPADDKPGHLQGRLSIQAPDIDGLTYLKIAHQIPTSGDFVQAKIIEAQEYDLIAEIV